MGAAAVDLLILVNAGLLDAARHSANGLFWFPTSAHLISHFRKARAA